MVNHLSSNCTSLENLLEVSAEEQLSQIDPLRHGTSKWGHSDTILSCEPKRQILASLFILLNTEISFFKHFSNNLFGKKIACYQ